MIGVKVLISSELTDLDFLQIFSQNTIQAVHIWNHTYTEYGKLLSAVYFNPEITRVL